MNKKAIVSIINVMIQNINSEAAQRDFAKGAFLAKESVLSGNPVPSLEGEERIYEWMAGDILTAIKNGKSKKITVFTYRPKKDSKRKMGHRQPYTKVQIQSINA